MKNKNKLIIPILLVLIIMLFVLCFTSCGKMNEEENGLTKIKNNTKLTNIDYIRFIQRTPFPMDYTKYSNENGIMTAMPNECRLDDWTIDIRSCDVSSTDYSDKLEELLYAQYDSRTVWPNNLPVSFDPSKMMELYKDPGLNVRELHKKGITGKGVGIAIIDQNLLVDHEQYKDNLVYYEETEQTQDCSASMHGCAVASIAVGKDVGVAPEADLYFFVNEFVELDENNNYIYNYNLLADDVKKIIEINKKLPADRKIRVISISLGISDTISNKGYHEYMSAVNEAKSEGIEIISVGSTWGNDIRFMGMGRKPTTDPNDFESILPCLFWEDDVADNSGIPYIYVPMDFRTTASPTGQNEYVFYSVGGMSWAVPYYAAMYALACQVKPDITIEEFSLMAYQTGKAIDSTYSTNSGTETFVMRNILSPIDLFKQIQSLE